MSATDSMKRAWQDSSAEPCLPSLEAVREGADRFYRTIHRRNRREYAASLFVILFFGASALLLPGTWARIGAALVVAGTLFIAWQLHRRASAVAPPEEEALSLIAHQRAQLVRQRDALASVGTWYLLPLMPGMMLMLLSRAIENGAATLLRLGWHQYAWVGFMVLVFAAIWWANRAAARALGAEIDALDALGEER